MTVTPKRKVRLLGVSFASFVAILWLLGRKPRSGDD